MLILTFVFIFNYKRYTMSYLQILQKMNYL